MKFANRPEFKKYIFAENATPDTIEAVPDTQTDTQQAQGYMGYEKGYTINNMKPLTEGGRPPRGQQLNQLFKDITSVTQYLTIGGTYDLDETVSAATGYPRNALIVNDSGIYRSLVDDNQVTDLNNKTYWQFVLDFNPPKKIERIIGSFFYSAILLNQPKDVLRCDGKEYNIADYPQLKKFLDDGRIVNNTFTEWDKSDKNNNGNVGYFGYDQQNKKFRVPKIQSGTYLSPANMPNGKLDKVGRARYQRDRIVNIKGNTKFNIVNQFTNPLNTGCLIGDYIITHGSHMWMGLRNGVYDRRYHLEFDASKSPGVNVGDRVMPRTVVEELYVIVSEYY